MMGSMAEVPLRKAPAAKEQEPRTQRPEKRKTPTETDKSV